MDSTTPVGGADGGAVGGEIALGAGLDADLVAIEGKGAHGAGGLVRAVVASAAEGGGDGGGWEVLAGADFLRGGEDLGLGGEERALGEAVDRRGRRTGGTRRRRRAAPKAMAASSTRTSTARKRRKKIPGRRVRATLTRTGIGREVPGSDTDLQGEVGATTPCAGLG